MIDAIAFKFQTGTQWARLPERYGNWRGVYNRLRMWAVDGTWERVFTELIAQADADEDLNWAVSVDSTIVRAHQLAAGARKKGPRLASPSTMPSAVLRRTGHEDPPRRRRLLQAAGVRAHRRVAGRRTGFRQSRARGSGTGGGSGRATAARFALRPSMAEVSGNHSAGAEVVAVLLETGRLPFELDLPTRVEGAEAGHLDVAEVREAAAGRFSRVEHSPAFFFVPLAYGRRDHGRTPGRMVG